MQLCYFKHSLTFSEKIIANHMASINAVLNLFGILVFENNKFGKASVHIHLTKKRFIEFFVKILIFSFISGCLFMLPLAQSKWELCKCSLNLEMFLKKHWEFMHFLDLYFRNTLIPEIFVKFISPLKILLEIKIDY